jgi:hypothetical protein
LIQERYLFVFFRIRGVLLKIVLLQLRQLVKVSASAHCALERGLERESEGERESVRKSDRERER